MYRPLRESLCALLLAALLLTSANAAETAEPASPIDETESGLSTKSTEPPNVDTGQPGRTSGITGSDMDVEEETTSGGQSRGDAIFQTPASQSEEGPAYETESPERDETRLPDEPLGAADSGRREDGEPQGSTNQSPNDSEE